MILLPEPPTTLLTFTLRESTEAGLSFDSKCDFAAGILYDVKLLGRESLNLFRYSDSAIREAMQSVERVGCYIDHPPGESNDRSIRERFGAFEEPYLNEAGELCAKRFKYNKGNPFASEFEWLVKNAPQDVGFSINADARGKMLPDGSGIRVIESVRKVYSFDIVDKPATTSGVFNVRESIKHRRDSLTTQRIREATATMFPQTLQTALAELTQKITDGSIDSAAAITAFKGFLKMLGADSGGDSATPAPDAAVQEQVDAAKTEDEKDVKAMEGASRSKYPYVQRIGAALRKSAAAIEALNVREAERVAADTKAKVLSDRMIRVREKFTQASLPAEATSAEFQRLIGAAASDAEVDALIADRLTIFKVREATGSIRPDNPPASGTQTNTSATKWTDEQIKAQAAQVYGAPPAKK